MSLFALVAAALASAAMRSDYRGSIHPETYTSWGSWHPIEWCPEGTWASGFSLKVEGSQGGGRRDDTALNAIKLICRTRYHADNSEITSGVGPWGRWTTVQYCGWGYHLSAARARSEQSQGGDPLFEQDDTAANNYKFTCSNGRDGVWKDGEGMSWGYWTDWEKCPTGSYICGIKTQVESSQGGNSDDTALNDAIFYCCDLS